MVNGYLFIAARVLPSGAQASCLQWGGKALCLQNLLGGVQVNSSRDRTRTLDRNCPRVEMPSTSKITRKTRMSVSQSPITDHVSANMNHGVLTTDHCLYVS